MSYILEALKKAEAERRSGATHAAPLPPGFGGGHRRPSSPRRQWLWIALPAMAATLAGTAWLASRDSPLPPVTAPVAANPPAPVPAAALPAAPAPAPAPVAALPADTPAKPQGKAAPKNPEKKRRPPAADTATARAPERRDDAPVAALRDLPEHIQREIPALAVGGYIYSASRADRSVLINKRLLREGDEIAPGLTLEQMTPNAMVLNYKGYRYRASY